MISSYLQCPTWAGISFHLHHVERATELVAVGRQKKKKSNTTTNVTHVVLELLEFNIYFMKFFKILTFKGSKRPFSKKYLAFVVLNRLYLLYFHTFVQKY